MKRNNMIAEMQSDPRTYIESAGKDDKQTVIDALKEGGDSTVLRLCLGASVEETPLRALGYLASAIAVQKLYLPKAQLQIVHPINAIEAANDIPLAYSKEKAKQIRLAALYLFRGHDQDRYHNRVTYLFDRPASKNNGLEARVALALNNCSDIEKRLGTAAVRRNGHMVSYVASHLRTHDTAATNLEPVDRYFFDTPAAHENVISIGAQSERPFYTARMLCKRLGIVPEAGSTPATGQLFTRHVIPPYLQCREGEPCLSDIFRSPFDIGLPIGFSFRHSVPSVSRDLTYLKSALDRQGFYYIKLGPEPSSTQGEKQ